MGHTIKKVSFRMGAGCCKCVATLSTRVTAGLLLTAGLGVVVYGVMLLAKAINGFSIFVACVGVYMILLGTCGCSLGSMKAARCFTLLYVFMLALAIIVEATAACAQGRPQVDGIL